MSIPAISSSTPSVEADQKGHRDSVVTSLSSPMSPSYFEETRAIVYRRLGRGERQPINAKILFEGGGTCTLVTDESGQKATALGHTQVVNHGTHIEILRLFNYSNKSQEKFYGVGTALINRVAQLKPGGAELHVTSIANSAGFYIRMGFLPVNDEPQNLGHPPNVAADFEDFTEIFEPVREALAKDVMPESVAKNRMAHYFLKKIKFYLRCIHYPHRDISLKFIADNWDWNRPQKEWLEKDLPLVKRSIQIRVALEDGREQNPDEEPDTRNYACTMVRMKAKI